MLSRYRTVFCACALFMFLPAITVSSSGSIVLADDMLVVGVDPPMQTLDAPTNTSVVVDFDHAVDIASLTSDSFRVFGRWSGLMDGAFALSNADQTVTFTPARNFSAGEIVRVMISHDVEATDGSPLRSAGFSYSFWTATVAGSLQFAQVETISTNGQAPGEHSQPYGGIASDLDHDGWLDLAIINEVTEDLRVFLNKADGSVGFEPFIQPAPVIGNFASPSEPSDFNHDGFTDICIANQGSQSVSIRLGAGDGTFLSHQIVNVGIQPRGIAVLDVNGDGYTDIATSNYLSNNISLLINDGAGVFGPAVFFDPSPANERALAAADMNNDGISDLVIGNQDAQTITIALGNGDTTFTTVSTQPCGGSVWMLVVGDVNGDGNEDVTAANSSSNVSSVLLGDGTGNLGAPVSYGTDPFPLATDLADLDGDGDLDWITASFNGDWRLFENDGNGNFTVDAEFNATAAASCSIAMDADNDGDLDLALVDEVADELRIYRNCGDGSVECQCQVASAPAADMIGTTISAKNRFLSFSGGDAGRTQAVRVTFASLPPAFAAWNGVQMYVQEPFEVSEVPSTGIFDTPAPGDATFLAARMGCDPVFRDWSDLGTVHVFDEGIVPSTLAPGGGSFSAPAVYDIQLIDDACSLTVEADFGPALTLTSAGWADLAELVNGEFLPPDDSVSVVDTVGILQAFAGIPGAPSKARADLLGLTTGPDPNIDGVIAVSELIEVIAAFGGAQYPFLPGPAPCQNP